MQRIEASIYATRHFGITLIYGVQRELVLWHKQQGVFERSGILPWNSFEHLSLKQDRNQKQRLMRLMHHTVPYPKLTVHYS